MLLLFVQAQPHGEVNDVTWKLLSIAGLAISALCGVVVFLAKILWGQMTGRVADLEATNADLRKKKNEGSDGKLRREA